ncbi:hypothetical protein, partial [uncultured Mucilaginibacter sp.]|uniref:hypothetical protein n=1 Tax=uncultured Mucilaginibacter sp. TaxID=797541 RepID=UPI0025FB2A34
MKPFLAFIIFLLFACNQPDHKTFTTAQHVNKTLKPIDTTIYAILKLDKRNDYLFEKNTKPSSITA